jgi:hypothetical protein
VQLNFEEVETMSQSLTIDEMMNARKRAKRRAQNSITVREELRLAVDGLDLLNDVTEIALALKVGTEPIVMADGGVVQTPLARDRVSSLKAAADVKLALLRKVLPDLKAVELSGPEGGPLQLDEVNPLDLLNRLRHFSEAALNPDGGETGGVPGEPAEEPVALTDELGEVEGSETVGSPGWTAARGFL